MPSETFYCPHCKRQLTKSAQAYVLGEAMEKNSHFIVMGDKPTDVICPGCGGRIDSMKMIKGLYDLDPITKKYEGLYIIGMIVTPFIFRFVVHWSWIASILVGLLAGTVAAQIIIEIIKSGGSKK